MQFQYHLEYHEPRDSRRLVPAAHPQDHASFFGMVPRRGEAPDFCRLMHWLADCPPDVRSSVTITIFPADANAPEETRWGADIYAHYREIAQAHELAKIARQIAFEADNHAFNANAFQWTSRRRLYEQSKDSASRAANTAAEIAGECAALLDGHTKADPTGPAMPILREYRRAAQECAEAAAQSVASIKERA